MLTKSLVLLSALAFALTIYQYTNSTPTEDLRELWNAWKTKYAAIYSDPKEDEYRFTVFAENHRIITEHNAKKLSFDMGINKFSNLTLEEFSRMWTTGWAIDPDAPEDPYCPSAVNCSSFGTSPLLGLNWTANGAVTPVNNNGPNCGASWAFSSAEALEGLLFLNTSTLEALSAQQLVDCTLSLGCQACDGCWPFLAFEYSAKRGIETAADYPYNGQQNNCGYNAGDAIHVNTGFRCVAQKNVTEMLGAVTSQPVAIGVQASNAVFMNYKSGIVDSGCGAETDHAALVVGWTTVNNVEAWIVKNSWGTDWGVNGYIFIGMEPVNNGFGNCGIYRCGTIPTNDTSI